MKTAIVLGAGISGLSCALKLSEAGHKVTVVEKEDRPGGMSSSFEHQDCVLDYGPHKIYTQLPEVSKKINDLLGQDLLSIKKSSKVRLKGKYYDYPVKVKDILLKMPLTTSFKCVFDIVFKKKTNYAENYEDYLISKFGKSLYQLTFEPYARKVWGDPKKLSSSLAKSRIAVSSIWQIVKMLLSKANADVNAEIFQYPKLGIKQLSDAMVEKIKNSGGEVLFDSKPKKIKVSEGKVQVLVSKNGKNVNLTADHIISTIPVSELPALLGAPKEIIDAAKGLSFVPLLIVYLKFDKPRLFPENWLFFPEKYAFHRLSEQKGFSKLMCSESQTVLIAETTKKELFDADLNTAARIICSDLVDAGIISKNDSIIDIFAKKLNNAYPYYGVGYEQSLSKVLNYLDSFKNIFSTGRQGLFNYNNMDHCMDMGFKTADAIIENKNWPEARKGFVYTIVD